MFSRRPPSRLAAALRAGLAALRGFRAHQGGQIAIIFAVSALTLTTAVGAGVDLSRMFVARQQLYHAATLTCQYSARPAVVSVAYTNGSGTATYINQVNQQAARFVTAQAPGVTQTNASPFTYAMGGTSSVSMAATVPTFFMGLAGVQTLPVATTVSCANGQSQADDTQPSILIHESFENSACTGTCWSTFAPNGRAGVNAVAASSTPLNAPLSNYGYTGESGTQWSIMGYCLEVDHSGVIKSTVADGSYSAELDCDNGSGSAGNSSISSRQYLAAGSYELRYNYTGRIFYPNYSPAYVCGTTDTGVYTSDLAWANDRSAAGGPLRTNQINVYLDPDTSSNVTPPTHTTIDGTQQLAGADLIDECVYSDSWIERSVKITVTNPGYYWLSFAADGANDSYGGQLDNIRLCRNTCAGQLQDNFPSAWSNANLFEDTFESPQKSNLTGVDATGLMYYSYGTSGSGASGWPSQGAMGWAVSAVNQMDYDTRASAQGSQAISLDGTGLSATNRSISRYFYLVPGYYQLDYNYISDALINYAGANSTYCASPPYYVPNPYGSTQYPATHRITGAGFNTTVDTNIVTVMMTNNQVASQPNYSQTLYAATTYTNPNGSTTATPTIANDAFSFPTWTGNNSGRVNPVLDLCAFSNSWTHRTTYIQITKAGQYWLTFAAGGNVDQVGGAIDDVKLTGLRSLYGAAPPFSVVIPTQGPAPNSTYSPAANAGYTIVADPLRP